MKNLTVPVSEEFDEHIRKRMADGGFGTVTEYVRHTIRQDLEHAKEKELERLLLEGLDSPVIETTPEWVAEEKALLRKRARDRARKSRRR